MNSIAKRKIFEWLQKLSLLAKQFRQVLFVDPERRTVITNSAARPQVSADVDHAVQFAQSHVSGNGAEPCKSSGKAIVPSRSSTLVMVACILRWYVPGTLCVIPLHRTRGVRQRA